MTSAPVLHSAATPKEKSATRILSIFSSWAWEALGKTGAPMRDVFKSILIRYGKHARRRHDDHAFLLQRCQDAADGFSCEAEVIGNVLPAHWKVDVSRRFLLLRKA